MLKENASVVDTVPLKRDIIHIYINYVPWYYSHLHSTPKIQRQFKGDDLFRFQIFHTLLYRIKSGGLTECTCVGQAFIACKTHSLCKACICSCWGMGERNFENLPFWNWIWKLQVWLKTMNLHTIHAYIHSYIQS